MNGKTFKIVGTWAFALFLPVLVAGCNTIEGLGEDTEAADEAIDEEAEEEN